LETCVATCDAGNSTADNTTDAADGDSTADNTCSCGEENPDEETFTCACVETGP